MENVCFYARTSWMAYFGGWSFINSEARLQSRGPGASGFIDYDCSLDYKDDLKPRCQVITTEGSWGPSLLTGRTN